MSLQATLTVIGQWGAYPGPGEATSCYLLRHAGRSVLLDCGSAAISNLVPVARLASIDAVFLSHYHADHVADLHCLHYAARVETDLGARTDPLAVFGHPLSSEAANLGYLTYAEGKTYDPQSELEYGPFRLTFRRTIHPDPNFAMRIAMDGKVLVYTGDAGYDEGLADFAKGADLLICESSLYDEYRGRIPGHMSAGEAGQIARSAGAGHLLLSHLPHFGDHERLVEQASAAFTGRISLAAKWMEVEL